MLESLTGISDSSNRILSFHDEAISKFMYVKAFSKTLGLIIFMEL